MHYRSPKRVAVVLLLFVLLLTAFAPTASASISAKVNSSSARVYKSASTRSQSLGIKKNTRLTITAIAGSWARVSRDGKTAYMPLKSLAPTQKATGYATKSATVYNSSGKKIATVSKGTAVAVLGTVSGYYCVMNKSGTVGFMKSGTLTNKKPAAKKSPVTNVKKNTKKLTGVYKAIAIGMSKLGVRYSMDYAAPKAFNCSSFVCYCMGKAGYSMKGTAAAQAADGRYARIGLSGIRTGDILFFDTSGNGQVDHTAIYLGNNKFIEASRNAGKVQINTLTSWYKSHFKLARRPA